MRSQVASMLDRILKTGTRLALIHHTLSQLDGIDRALTASVLEHARERFVFGGMEPDSCRRMAELMFLKQISEPMVRETQKRILNRYKKVERISKTKTGERESVTTAPAYEIEQEEYDQNFYYTLEEKKTIFSEKLFYQGIAECWYQAPGQSPVPIRIPIVRSYEVSTEERRNYLMRVYEREGAVSLTKSQPLLPEIYDDSPPPPRKIRRKSKS